MQDHPEQARKVSDSIAEEEKKNKRGSWMGWMGSVAASGFGSGKKEEVVGEGKIEE